MHPMALLCAVWIYHHKHMPAQAAHRCVSQGKLALSSCAAAVQWADAFSSDAQEWRDPSTGYYLVLCLLCNLKQATEASWSSALPLLKALNNQSLAVRDMNKDLTAESNDKGQYRKEMPQLIHSRGAVQLRAAPPPPSRPHEKQELCHRRVVVGSEQPCVPAASSGNRAD